MGSCSIKSKEDNNQAIKVVLITQVMPSAEEEKKIDPVLLNPRLSKHKQKSPLVEVRKGSIPVMDAPTAQLRAIEKSARDIELIEKSFERHFIFNTLSLDQKKIVIGAMKMFILNSNQVIFRQGQPGNNFFVVGSGMLEVLVDDNRVNTITEGQGFGELALMHDMPRTASVRTLTPCSLWGLDRATFRAIIEEINAKNYEQNKAFIESVPIFNILRPAQIEALVGSSTTHSYAPGQSIVKEGDVGNLMFIIIEGMVTCTRKNEEIRKFGKGEYFGEQALIYNTPRTASCIAITQVKCLSVDRDSLVTALGEQLQVIIFKNSQSIAIERDSMLKKLALIQRDKLIADMTIKQVKDTEIIIEEGRKKAELLVMVLKGKLKQADAVFEKFSCIGANEMIEESEEIHNTPIIAEGEVDIAIITREGFIKSIGGEFALVTNNNEAFRIMKQIQILRNLSDEQLHGLIALMKIERYQANDLVFEQNSIGDSFYIIKSGKVEISIDGHVVRTVTKYDYFGERSMIFDSKRTATVVAIEEVECWVLLRTDFMQIIDSGLRNQLMKRIQLQDDDLVLNDLSIVKVLGKGMFGNVFLVIHKTTKVLYALKTVPRIKINAYDLQESLILERKVLLQLDHIFIMKLVKTLKDSKRLYFVLEYVRGMDLFDVIRKMPVVSENDSRFFTACLVVILQHLHERDIIYRDLKPENVVVDEDGYLKLIDFGTAKIVSGRTYTIVGTPHYMAPEVILRKGYGASVDYWSLGVVLYELLFERVPFADEEEDPMMVYEIVLTARLKYPRGSKPMPELKSMIDQLLNKNPALRMGSGFEKLKTHPWFARLDWDQLLSKRIKAPYIPAVKKLNLDRALEHSSSRGLDVKIGLEEDCDLPDTPSKAQDGWDDEF
jgi:cGMP-dependent protein kinase 1